jgi:hypothetical protein
MSWSTGANLGKSYPETTPAKPAYTPGAPIKATDRYEEDATRIGATRIGATRIEATGIEATGIEATGIEATGIEATGIEATGINVETRKPIDPRMPHMPPA